MLGPDKTDETGWAGLLGLAVPNLCSLFLEFFFMVIYLSSKNLCLN